MLIGVKFCGGCNPRYERGEFLERVKALFEQEASFELAKDDVEYDALLVLGGCSNCCPDYKHFKTRTEPILIWDENHLESVAETLENHLKDMK